MPATWQTLQSACGARAGAQGHAGVCCLRCRGMPLPPLPPPTLPADSHSAAHILLSHRRCRVLVAEANDCISTPLEFKRAFEQRQPRCVSSELVGRVVSARNVSGLRGEDTEQKLAYFWSASDALAKYLTIGYPEVGGHWGGGGCASLEISVTVELQLCGTRGYRLSRKKTKLAHMNASALHSCLQPRHSPSRHCPPRTCACLPPPPPPQSLGFSTPTNASGLDSLSSGLAFLQQGAASYLLVPWHFNPQWCCHMYCLAIVPAHPCCCLGWAATRSLSLKPCCSPCCLLAVGYAEQYMDVSKVRRSIPTRQGCTGGCRTSGPERPLPPPPK